MQVNGSGSEPPHQRLHDLVAVVDDQRDMALIRVVDRLAAAQFFGERASHCDGNMPIELAVPPMRIRIAHVLGLEAPIAAEERTFIGRSLPALPKSLGERGSPGLADPR